MKFKKIYIEITNICNLNCSFCSKSNLSKKELSNTQFEEVLKKINDYTDYIYLHVKGEPLLHKELDSILSLTKRYNKKVCITTNGVFLKEKLDILNMYDNIYQINISLHSENNKDNYLEDILYAVNELKHPYISLRFWTQDKGIMDSKTKMYLDIIKNKYNIDKIENNTKLKDKVYLSLDDKFIWPNINSDYFEENGTCYGGKSHIAILVDGTISICCLDSEGVSNLGNIFNSTLDDILSSEKYKPSIKGFQNNKAYLDICKHCSYKERFNNKK